ncbi:hypothetical protein SAMN05660662_1364 [Blastococcus aurantiacus]|uniref:Uncharacterized protein n=1 Tax=Blastococcus aurantiacus TaxID=1550231 RepID=A0A1G7J8V7_9ACTN|nr:hypothetical protein [Blastococcus aurantiacus]SDF21325.1 hypothetical protein SAMN05660662_1364 [Blastococcus aurantiacus]
MRRRVLASAVLLVAPVLSVPAASAAPVPAAPVLCAADGTRGAVPASFPVEACVDGTGMTLRNDRDRPVVVSGRGDLQGRVLLRSQNDARSDVVRRTAPAAMVLLPGEVARWSVGPGPALLTVAPLPVPSAPEIAEVLTRALAGEGTREATRELHDSVGALVLEIAAAAAARADCAEGRSFLGSAACDVTAAAEIGSATADHLDRRTTAEVLPQLLDPAAWAEWPLVDPDWPAGADGTLRQHAVHASPPAPSRPHASAATGGARPTAPSAAATRTPVARPAPAAAPTRAPARVTPAPVPAPAPAPAPASRPRPTPARPPVVVPPPPAPPAPPTAPAPPHVERPSGQEIHERNMARLRELAAAWEKAQEQARERERDHDRGSGRGRGRGNR